MRMLQPQAGATPTVSTSSSLAHADAQPSKDAHRHGGNELGAHGCNIADGPCLPNLPIPAGAAVAAAAATASGCPPAGGMSAGGERGDAGPRSMGGAAAAAQLLQSMLLLLAGEGKGQGGALASLRAVLRTACQAVEAAQAVERCVCRGCKQTRGVRLVHCTWQLCTHNSKAGAHVRKLCSGMSKVR